MIKPLVSILICVYNGEKFLEEALNSVLNQSYDNFEIVIIDDGSTDKTSDIISTFNSYKIKYFKNSNNLGLVPSLNLGLTKCIGDFIARMDADDFSENNRIELQVNEFLNNNELDVLGTWFTTFDNLGNSKLIKHPINHYDIKFNLLLYCCIGHPTVMFKRDLLTYVGFDIYNNNYKYFEDYELWTRLIFLFNFSNLPKSLLKYRIHDNQISSLNLGFQNTGSSKLRISYFKKLFNFQSILADEVVIDVFNFNFLNKNHSIFKLIIFLFQINFHNLFSRNFPTIYLLSNSLLLFYRNVKKH